jgi:hypothetical protein
MHRIEFVDDGILRDCTTDNHFTAATLFDVLQRKYPQVYWYTMLGETGEELTQFYNVDLAAA